jgi:tetratricopeptide (TPR) repeat protein
MTDDHATRVLRARAYLGKNDTSDAMTDLDYVLTFMPGNAEALTLRGEVRSLLHDYGPALTDLNLALDKQETIEGYFARGKIKSMSSRAAFPTRPRIFAAPPN